MRADDELLRDQSQPLTSDHHALDAEEATPSSASATSLVFDHLSGSASRDKPGKDNVDSFTGSDEYELADYGQQVPYVRPIDRAARRLLWVATCAAILGWIIAFGLFVGTGKHIPLSSRPHDPHATHTPGTGKKIQLEQILTGKFYARRHAISWTSDPTGKDGMLLQRGGLDGRDYLVVEDVRHMDNSTASKANSKTLMKEAVIKVGDEVIWVSDTWTAPDQKHVLLSSDRQSKNRYSFTARYWILNVETQTAEALDVDHPHDRVQHASWAPTSDAIVYTKDNNMYLRRLSSNRITTITTDGGEELFYGVPDWVSEEEVLKTDSATWWSDDGKYIAYLRTNETIVPTYPVQYFFSSPQGVGIQNGHHLEGTPDYPTVRNIKYPKAGVPGSTVTLQFYDMQRANVFTVNIDNDFADDDRIITEVMWAGKTGKVLIRENNRVSDILKIVLIDANAQSAEIVREDDIAATDGGWLDPVRTTRFVPADPANSRPQDGYLDTVFYDDNDHLAYFPTLDAKKPIMLTTGAWQVVDAPESIDLARNLVYFIATKKAAIERHLYSVKLDGTGLTAITDVESVGYYTSSFSDAAGFILLSYQGPGVPWQKVMSAPGSEHDVSIDLEQNEELQKLASHTELPLEIYDTIEVDGYKLNYVERRPPHFDPSRKYPVLFQLYNGPGYQHVDRKFSIDFQSYVASNLDYIVVTVDGRGTGFMGRKHKCIIRDNIGHYEAHDQIAAAKHWASKAYVDSGKLALWGWSYGAFVTLKTLEVDAGRTFSYGMAVAPVTDWRYYDNVYSERYMHTPQANPSGYDNATINNMTALGQNVRFLVMHGVADDNVHMQNTLALLDKLDRADVINYDVHFFPDSDHGIYFHNGNRVVYQKLRDWLINAFNDEWTRTKNPRPNAEYDRGL